MKRFVHTPLSWLLANCQPGHLDCTSGGIQVSEKANENLIMGKSCQVLCDFSNAVDQ